MHINKKWIKSQKKMAEDKRKASMFFRTNREKIARRKKEESEKRKKRNQRVRKSEEQVRQKRIDEFGQRQFDNNLKLEFKKADTMKQNLWKQSQEIVNKNVPPLAKESAPPKKQELAQEDTEKQNIKQKMKHHNQTTKTPKVDIHPMNSHEQDIALDHLTVSDSDSNESFAHFCENCGWSCFFCKRWSCIDYNTPLCSSSMNIFNNYEKELRQKYGTALTKHKARTFLTQKFLAYQKGMSPPNNKPKLVMYCGLPFCVVKCIKQKYGKLCSQCKSTLCAFYQLFDDLAPSTISMMEGGIPMRQVRQFLYNQYAYKMDVTCIGGGHHSPPLKAEPSKSDSDSDSGPTLNEIYADANGTLLPTCVLRKIYKIFQH